MDEIPLGIHQKITYFGRQTPYRVRLFGQHSANWKFFAFIRNWIMFLCLILQLHHFQRLRGVFACDRKSWQHQQAVFIPPTASDQHNSSVHLWYVCSLAGTNSQPLRLIWWMRAGPERLHLNSTIWQFHHHASLVDSSSTVREILVCWRPCRLFFSATIAGHRRPIYDKSVLEPASEGRPGMCHCWSH